MAFSTTYLARVHSLDSRDIEFAISERLLEQIRQFRLLETIRINVR